MTTKVINLDDKRAIQERGRINATINEYYQQLLERDWIVSVPEKEK